MVNKWYNTLISVAKNPFEILEDVEIVNDANVTSTYASIYNLFMVVGAIGVACSLIWYNIKLMTTKNSAARQEIKEAYCVKIIIATAMSGAVFILNLILTIATSFV